MTSTSPMHETGHPKQCSGTTQRDRVKRKEGGGFRMGGGGTCVPVAELCQCMV